jgi:hypothetical protein
MVWVVSINNVLDEDTGEVGVVHVETDNKAAAEELIANIVREELADPKDFALTSAPDDWECGGVGDGPFCMDPRFIN